MRPASRTDWERLPADPEARDLGYPQLDLEVVRAPARDGSGQLLFLPKDEDMLKDDAFIVADGAVVCDLDRYR